MNRVTGGTFPAFNSRPFTSEASRDGRSGAAPGRFKYNQTLQSFFSWLQRVVFHPLLRPGFIRQDSAIGSPFGLQDWSFAKEHQYRTAALMDRSDCSRTLWKSVDRASLLTVSAHG